MIQWKKGIYNAIINGLYDGLYNAIIYVHYNGQWTMDKGQWEVGILVNETCKEKITEFKAISERIVLLKMTMQKILFYSSGGCSYNSYPQ